MTAENVEKKQFVMFDVICFEKKSFEEYEELLQSNKINLIPSLKNENLSSISMESLAKITKLYDQWAISFIRSKKITNNNDREISSINPAHAQVRSNVADCKHA